MQTRPGWCRRGPAAGVIAALMLTVAFTLAQVSAALGAVSPQWPVYGHDSAHTGNSPVNGPVTAHLLWKFQLPHGVSFQSNASPVVGPDGTIYMPTDNGFFAINPDGTLKWKKWTGAFAAPPLTREAPAVASDGTAVYVWRNTFTSGRLYALNPANGNMLWSVNVGYATYGSPTIGPDGTIYLGAQPGTKQNGSLYAINPDGTLKWVWHGGGAGCWIESSAALGPDGTIYINHNCQGLVALSPTGAPEWARNVGDAWNSPSVGPDGTIYIGNSDFYFYAYHPNGTLKWRVPVRAWMYLSSTAISADGSAIYRGDNSGNFYDFSSTGHILWRFQPADHGPVFSAPVLSANGLVYFTQEVTNNSDPSLYALQASTGRVVWDYSAGSTDASPVLGPDGTLYVAGGTAVYAFR